MCTCKESFSATLQEWGDGTSVLRQPILQHSKTAALSVICHWGLRKKFVRSHQTSRKFVFMRGKFQCYASGLGRCYFRAAIVSILSVSIIISLEVMKEILRQIMASHRASRKCVSMRGELQCYALGMGKWYFRAAIASVPSLSIIISLGVKEGSFTQIKQAGNLCTWEESFNVTLQG